MGSKYDAFWQDRAEDLERLINLASESRDPVLDVSGIRRLGKRDTWSGSVTVASRGIHSTAAQLTSLAHLVLRLGLSARYPDAVLTFTMNQDCELKVHLSESKDIRAKSAPRLSESARLPKLVRPDASNLSSPIDSHTRKTRLHENVAANHVVGLVEACAEIHRLLYQLPVYHDPRDVPFKNGLYFFYETGETNPHGPGGRIVRIGNHPHRDDRLVGRLKDHYNKSSSAKNASVFRLLLGGALIRREDPTSLCLAPGPGKGHWENGKLHSCTSCKSMELRVTDYLQREFSFRCVRIDDRAERNRFEALLVANVAACDVCQPSTSWLGSYAYGAKIRSSGLWNRQFVGGPTMTDADMDRFRILVKNTLQHRVSETSGLSARS